MIKTSRKLKAEAERQRFGSAGQASSEITWPCKGDQGTASSRDKFLYDAIEASINKWNLMNQSERASMAASNTIINTL